MNNNWKHFKTAYDGDYCEIEGINVWKHKWKSDYETIIVKDPIYGETKSFNKFWIELPNNKIEPVVHLDKKLCLQHLSCKLRSPQHIIYAQLSSKLQ